MLESKKQMRARGVKSPDDADAFFLTFAQPVLSSKIEQMLNDDHDEIETDFDPYDDGY